MTTAEYKHHRDSYDGFCLACKDWTRLGNTEPDARPGDGYICPDCDGDTCVGAEEALVMDLIQVEE